MTMYLTETYEKKLKSQVISISNLTPDFREDEKITVKKNIEQKLYEVFCKYVSVRT